MRISALILFLVFMFIIPIGGIFLQIYLSKKEGKWPGLILPIAAFAFSLIAAMGIAVFTQIAWITHSAFYGEQWVSILLADGGRHLATSAIAGVVAVFFIANIPTLVLLIIYKVMKGKQNRYRDVKKMSIQDL